MVLQKPPLLCGVRTQRKYGMKKPSNREMARAREEFRHLLAASTKEADWQHFFSRCPYILSLSLPLRLEPSDIVPLGRPGQTEPDILFYPRNTMPVPYYGVIELKKPSSRIATITRKNVAILSRDAQTAIQEAMAYSENIERYVPSIMSSSPFVLGNRSYLFVIMGLSDEISQKLGKQLYHDMITKILPQNLQLIPYDILLKLYEAHVNPHCYFLFPAQEEDLRRELQARIQEIWKIVYGVAVDHGIRGRETLARTAHGYRPEWLIRTWMQGKYSNIDALRDIISAGLPNSSIGELENLAHALGDAALQAEKWAHTHLSGISGEDSRR
jgi:hypothetical protein